MKQWSSAVTDWITHLTAAGKRPQTIDKYVYRISRLVEDQITRSPWKISGDQLEAWLAAQPWEPSTRRSYAYTIRAFYRWASDTGRVRVNPAARLAVKVPRGVPRPIPHQVADQAMTGATDRDTLIVLLGLDAGLRRSEIAALEWAHIETTSDGEHLRIGGKGGHERLVPIGRRLSQALAAELDRRRRGTAGTGFATGAADSRYIFAGRFGSGHMHRETITKIGKRLLRGWCIHATRHAYATDLLEAGVDLSRVQELLGHASPVSTRIYTEVSMRARRAAVVALDTYRQTAHVEGIAA